MTEDEAVQALDALDAIDPEGAHAGADEILKELAPKAVQEALDRLIDRCSWWAHA